MARWAKCVLFTVAAAMLAGTAHATTFWGVSTRGPDELPPYVPASEPVQRSNESLLPRPEVVTTAVKFWTQVYTEVDTSAGLIHDARHLDVVYEVIELPDNASRRTRSRVVKAAKKRYRAILNTLASGRRSGLDSDAQRVLALWQHKPDELADAAGRLRFQLGQSDRFREGLTRSGAWGSYIRQRFADAGLPVELAALPHVESSFNPGARSNVGATGMWQFTRSTGRRYMRIDHVVDERLDPFLATDAAVQLLSHDYQMTGAWPLAITAYNHGAAGMRRASNVLKTKDIGVIIEQYRGRTFGFASRNFYPAFLAAVDIDADPEHYFGPLQRHPAADHTVLETDTYYPVRSLSGALGVEFSTLRSYNPALREPVWLGDKYVPKGFPIRTPRSLETTKRSANLAAAEHYDTQRPDEFHRVQRGEALSIIASQYGVSVRQLVAMNDLRSPDRIRAGTVLRLPIPAGSARAQQAVLTREIADAALLSASVATPEPVSPVREANIEEPATALILPEMDLSADPSDYTVAADGTIEIQPVETLGHYAEWLDIRAAQLRQRNGMRYGKPVVVGRRLELDFSKVDVAVFESRRRAFHRELQEAFFARRHITGTTRHVVKTGDSLWELSEVRYNVPVWLLRQYNPDLDLRRIRPGHTLVVPLIASGTRPMESNPGQTM
ncbi:MAG: LysM peptidoglycan-binding domain-containing protein [Gammaproteobacteria bacterium]|nr:MAG: LysM peptidoglycan-binding domain-containing protein [Gammaproteobacteria bacterium]